jgi:hypothetical protein
MKTFLQWAVIIAIISITVYDKTLAYHLFLIAMTLIAIFIILADPLNNLVNKLVSLRNFPKSLSWLSSLLGS